MRIKRLLYAIATILPFLFLCSCYEEQEPQQEKQDKEKWTMQVAGNQLNEFLNINPDLRNLYAYPDWDAAQIIRERSDTVSYYVPVVDITADTCSYLIIARASNDVYLYMVRLPKEYSGFDSFLEEHLKILRIIDGARRVPVGYLHNFPDDVLTRTRSSGSLFNRDRETNTEILENNTFVKDDLFGAGFSLPEVTVIGRRPTSSEDPFKWPFGDMPSESPKALPGLDDFFSPQGGGSSSLSSPQQSGSLPKPEEVIKDATVKKALEEAWSDMLKRSTKDQRQEVGFWIYYDPVKKQYYIGKKRYGMAVKNDGKARGNISLGDKSPSVNGVPATAKVVASFHTHTPMTEIKGMKRKVGPSKEDKGNADKNRIPIIVYDYIGTKDPRTNDYYVIGGHTSDADKKIYTYTPKK